MQTIPQRHRLLLVPEKLFGSSDHRRFFRLRSSHTLALLPYGLSSLYRIDPLPQLKKATDLIVVILSFSCALAEAEWLPNVVCSIVVYKSLNEFLRVLIVENARSSIFAADPDDFFDNKSFDSRPIFGPVKPPG